MSTVYRFSADEDLTLLRQWLWHDHISHYYRQQDTFQLIILINDAQQGQAHALIERWRRGELVSPASSAHGLLAGRHWRGGLRTARRQPVTTLMLLTCAVLYVLWSLQWSMTGPIVGTLYSPLVVVPPESFPVIKDTLHTRIALSDMLHQREWWRLVTPILLHFSWLHLAFNMTWLWTFGGRIERDEGSIYWIGVVVLWGVVSNLAELFYGTALFGGMSGVLYAVIGYLWVEQVTGRRRTVVVPGWLLLMVVLWAFLGVITASSSSDELSVFGIERMANAAHFSGLLAGCATALLSSLWHRLIARRHPE